jgi:hypothetical protein
VSNSPTIKMATRRYLDILATLAILATLIGVSSWPTSVRAIRQDGPLVDNTWLAGIDYARLHSSGPRGHPPRRRAE